jgi:hypothetical protein
MRTHIEDYLVYKTETTRGQEPVGSATPLYIVVDGEIEVNENLKVESAIGGVVRYYSIVEPSASVTLLVVPSVKPFLQSARRSGTNLSSYTLEGGTADFGIKLLGAHVDELGLEARVGEALRATLRFVAMGAQATSGAVQAGPTESPIDWSNGVATIANSNYQLASLRATLRNNVKLEADFTSRPAGQRRWRNLFGLGQESVEATLEIYLPYSAGIAADTLAAIAAQIVFGPAAAPVLTLSLNDMLVNRRRVPVKGGDDLWVMTLELTGRPGSLSIT